VGRGPAAHPASSANGKWRVFYTQQHGDNNTFEIILNPGVAVPFHDDHDRDSDDD